MVRRVVAPWFQHREAFDRVVAMTLGAQRVASGPQIEAMRVMAVRAAHAGRVHPALYERTIDVDLVHDLPVRVVQPLAQERGQVVVEQRAAVGRDRGQRLSTRMAGGAGVDFDRRGAGRERRNQSPGLRGAGVGRAGAGQFDVRRAWAVARLAADVHLGPGRLVAIALTVVALPQVGRVAGGAHQVPVLITAGPVQRVVRCDPFVGVQREPAPLRRVPRDGQALQPPARKRGQILLQRVDAEGIRQLEVGRLAVGAFRVHEESIAAAKEPRGDTEMCERRVVEVAQNRFGRGRLHGEVVVRAGPGGIGVLVAAGAVRFVDIGDPRCVDPAFLPGPVAGPAGPRRAGADRRTHRRAYREGQWGTRGGMQSSEHPGDSVREGPA